MRLDFNVLWVEDQQSLVLDQQKNLERRLRREGFALNVEFAANISEATSLVSNDIYSDHIDLVLMDYELKDGEKGDAGLQYVRGALPYKDIIFYSARAQNLRDLLSESKVEGVYLSTRQSLPDTVHGVFENLVKKVLDIDHSRGIVMGATSDIDQSVNEALILIFNTLNTQERAAVMQLIATKLEEKKADYETTMARLQAAADLEDIFKAHGIYTSVDRLHLLRKILKSKEIHADKDKTLLDYSEQAVPRRNLLAHVTVQKNGFSRRLFDKKGNEFTSDQMKELRLLILNHREVFQAILDDLNQK